MKVSQPKYHPSLPGQLFECTFCECVFVVSKILCGAVSLINFWLMSLNDKFGQYATHPHISILTLPLLIISKWLVVLWVKGL